LWCLPFFLNNLDLASVVHMGLGLSRTLGTKMKKDFRLGLESLETKNLLTNVVVAIVDSGIDLNHSYLKDNLWVNPYEIVDGKDNDNNGYVDDINGWDFVNNDNVPQDSFYHGTAVGGVIKSADANVKLMSLRFQDSNGLGYTGAAASAIDYATNMKLKGINVGAINLSWGGGTSSSLVLQNSIKRANDAGIIVVSAAGNNGDNNDITPRYPSSYKFSNSISVAGSIDNVSLAGFSNYGKNSVEVASNSVAVYASLPNNNYGYVSGTSFAAPYVAGMVSVLKRIGSYSIAQIKQAILVGCDIVQDISSRVAYGLVNLSKSLSYISSLTPAGSVVVDPPVPVNPPAVIVLSPVAYRFDKISKSLISGWATDSGNTANKLKVEVKINSKMVYSGWASALRNDSYSGNGFNLNLKKYFIKKKNMVEIRFIDSVNSRSVLGYSGIIKR